MLESIISSKIRIKLLLKFFLNSKSSAYLRGLESELGENTNTIRIELNRLVNADLLKARVEGNKKLYCANEDHPLFEDLHRIIRKYIGIDTLLNKVIGRLGNLERAYILKDYARGMDSGVIDLLLIGNIDQNYLISLIPKAEKLTGRKIRYLTYRSKEDYSELLKEENLLIWGG